MRLFLGYARIGINFEIENDGDYTSFAGKRPVRKAGENVSLSQDLNFQRSKKRA
jgi:hypothetical protein